MKLVKTLLAASLGAVIAASSMNAVQAKDLTIGFSQIGAESEWRTANTNDIKAAAEKQGVNLKFSDAQQKQENQIKAIRTFIAQKVDLIGFVPIVATGWDNVLREAKRAKIPVVIVDRDLTVSDPSLYVAKIGTDSVAEGKKEAAILEAEAEKQSAILRAEAQKEKMIREAEGQAEAIKTIQLAQAEGLRYLKEVQPDDGVIQIKSLEAFAKAADGKATKIIIPSDIQGLAGTVKSIAEVVKEN